MNLMERMVEQARANKQRIVLPEGTEERTLQAADRILADNIADIILIGDPNEIKALADKYGLKHIDKATLVNPSNHDKKETYTQLLYELRKEKGMTLEKAQKTVEDPLFLGCLMIKNGDADGEVAGARNTTGNVLRSAFQIIKTAPGVKVVSGAFLMFVPDQSYGENGLMVFADCAVLPNPTASELAQIAISTAKTARDIANIEPRIAMLSFSSKGSASHEMVDKVVEATRLAREMFGLHTRELTKKEIYSGYGQKIFQLINLAYAPIFGYAELSERQINFYLNRYVPLLDTRMLSVVEDEKGGLVAAAITMRSLALALQKSQGRLFPFGWFHLLRALTCQREDKAEMLLVAVHPDYQGLGVNALFFENLIPVYNRLGIRWAETGPQLESNVRELSQWKPLNPGFVKRRRCYTKDLYHTDNKDIQWKKE